MSKSIVIPLVLICALGFLAGCSGDEGFTYFDTTLGKPVYWNGSGWVNANGTAS